MRQEAPVQEEPINLTIVSPPEAPEKVVEQPVQTIQPPPLERVIEPPKEIVPVTDAPAPVLEKVEPQIEQKKMEQPVQKVSNGDAESVFAQDVRARIERKKIYPDTARDLGLSGEVEVQYELDRAGNLMSAEIVASSGHRLLDQAALRAVKTVTYKGFPEDAWVGSGSKVFRTKLIFSINQ
jgi:protein TonB